jgi:hypothetical protein
MNYHFVTRFGISKIEPNASSVANKGRPKFHINEASLGYVYCNVEFCVDCGTDI